jgi:hypothetical protein
MVPALKANRHIANLGHAADKGGAEFFFQPLLGHGPCGHHGRRQARRRTATATRIAQAVFAPVGVVGMARAEGLQDVAVVLAALVGVLDQQANRRAGGQALVHAREDLHRIGLVALGNEFTGAGATPVQIGLDVGLAQGQARRAAVDHAANGRAMGFTKVGDRKKLSKGIAAHVGHYPRAQPLSPGDPAPEGAQRSPSDWFKVLTTGLAR